jgi:hypothetical protein
VAGGPHAPPTATPAGLPTATIPAKWRVTVQPPVYPTPLSLPAAPTPAHVPAGWQVLHGPPVSFAYPPGWTVNLPQPNTAGANAYALVLPNASSGQGVVVGFGKLPPGAEVSAYAPYCQRGMQHTTLADLPMVYFSGDGEASDERTWWFVNADGVMFTLGTSDLLSPAATRAVDDAILATFTPYDATPYSCQ